MQINQFPETWQQQWQQNGFAKPAVIQEKTYDLLVAGKNVLGISPTGSGKTLAYLLPLLTKVTPKGGTQLLVLASSQELAMQVVDVARVWASLIGLTVQPLIGGANVKRQVEKLKEKKPEIIIGTPGRVLELIKDRKVKANQIKTVVFDEVDQLLLEQSATLIADLNQAVQLSTQKVYFSATGERVIDKVQEMEEVEVIDVRAEDHSQGEITHGFIQVNDRKKLDTLRSLLNVADFYGLLFFTKVTEMDVAEQKLTFNHLAVATLASDQSKSLRKLALDQFRQKRVNGLLTTDIAARGLDIPDLTFVVNYDVPFNAESYVHRSGRVGRMGKKGTVLTLVALDEVDDYKKMMKLLNHETTEFFLYGGKLNLERPVKQAPVVKEATTSPSVAAKVPVAREKTMERVVKSANRQTEKRSNEPTHREEELKRKKSKTRKKNKKNKGARRKPSAE
jgi:superfamily II DNA/RNA helicase